MTIQRLIVASAAVGLLALGLLAGLAIFGANAAARSTAHIEAAEARAEIVARLVADAHAYAEQVAAVLLFGKGSSDGLGTARIEMERGLSHLNQTTRQQITDLGGMDEVATQLPEVDTTRRMIELYHAIDMSAASVTHLLDRYNQAVKAAEAKPAAEPQAMIVPVSVAR